MAAGASAAAEGEAISGLTCAKTRVLGHCRLDKKPALCISHRFLQCFPQQNMLNFRAALCQNSTLSHMPDGGMGGGGGVIASVPMRPTCSVSIIMFCCLLCAHLQGWGGGWGIGGGGGY